MFIDFIIKLCVSGLGTTLFTVISYAMVELPWANFGTFFFYAFLCKTAMESLLVCAPAIGKTAVVGQQQIMPVLMLCFLFNGFAITKKTAPDFMVRSAPEPLPLLHRQSCSCASKLGHTTPTVERAPTFSRPPRRNGRCTSRLCSGRSSRSRPKFTPTSR